MTPMWITKRDYTKLKIECEFKAEIPEIDKLKKMFDDFCHDQVFGNNEALVKEAYQLYESALYD